MEIEKLPNILYLLIKNNKRYSFILAVFGLSFFYHYFILPPEIVKNVKNTTGKTVFIEKSDFNKKIKEKTYSKVLSAQSGDIFRIGGYIKTRNHETLEVYARSSLGDLLMIGTWELSPSQGGEYKEILFNSPGWYEDIVLRLKYDRDKSIQWDDSAVYIHSFSVTRIEATVNTVKNLQPTIFGLSSIKKEALISEKSTLIEQENINWVFQSHSDFIQEVEFSGEIVGDSKQSYNLKLTSLGRERTEKEMKIVQNASFTLGMLRESLLPSGNYGVPFFSPLKKDEWYALSLTKNISNDNRSFFKIGSLQMDDSVVKNKTENDIMLHLGVHYLGKNDAVFPDGAKLQDLGKNLFYSFVLHGRPIDYTNIFEMSDGVSFNGEKRLVTGKQKNGEFFSYRFDTVYPFDRLVIEGEQDGNNGHEIKLEYSLDNAFWKEIPFLQGKGQPQVFSLALLGTDNAREIYVRASYNGDEKKSGTFALKKLSVNASVAKFR